MISDIHLDKAEKCLNGVILKIQGRCTYAKIFLLYSSWLNLKQGTNDFIQLKIRHKLYILKHPA